MRARARPTADSFHLPFPAGRTARRAAILTKPPGGVNADPLYRSRCGPATIRSRRGAAAVFLAVTAPLALAIALSGGLVALAPLLLLVLPILATGRPPGIEALERVRRAPRPARSRPPRARSEARRARRTLPDSRPAARRSAGRPRAAADGLTGGVQAPPGAGADRLASPR